MTDRSLLEAALAYAARGWYVAPLKPGKKTPLTRNGHSEATTDPEQIRAWWTRWPDANIALACKPSGLAVLDVDVAGSKAGKESFAALLAEHGDLPTTLVQRTARGGLHLLYADPDNTVRQRLGIRPGIDIITSGYIVLHPSVLTDDSGTPLGTYRWERQDALAPVPAVIAHLTPFRAVSRPPGPSDGTPGDATDSPLPAGTRNASLFRLGCALRDQGIGELALQVALLAEYQRRCEPEITDKIQEEIRKIAASVMRTVTPSRDVAAGQAFAEAIMGAKAEAKSDAVKTDEAEPSALPTLIGAVARETPIATRVYTTGFPQLDALLGGGLATRQVCGVIAPPSTGKSGFVGGIIMHIWNTYKLPQLHVSTELPRDEMMIRHACYILGLPWRDGLKGIVSRAAMERVLKDHKIYLVGSDDIDRADPMLYIASKALAIEAAEGKMPGITVDYVQLLARGSEGEARGLVGVLTMKLRALSQELDTTVLAVFSTSRAFYGTARQDNLRSADDPTMYLAAAKESGDIEYDCATILYLALDQSPDQGARKKARIVVARCRIGEVGFAGASFEGAPGIWRPDEAAVAAMSAEGRKAKSAEMKDERGDASIIGALTLNGALTRNEIRDRSGMKGTACKNAVDRLLMQGRLVTRDEIRLDSLKRSKNVTLIAIPGGVPMRAEPTPTPKTVPSGLPTGVAGIVRSGDPSD